MNNASQSEKQAFFDPQMYKNRQHPTEVECRLFCCPILLGRCRFCSFLKLLSYRHTPETASLLSLRTFIKKPTEIFKKGLQFVFGCAIILLLSSHGPLVKRLRHRPLTAKTGVRFSHGSPKNAFAVCKCVFFLLLSRIKHKPPCRARGLVLPSIYCGAMRP